MSRHYSFVERQHPRFAAQFPVAFYGHREGTGIVVDLSLGGCRIDSQTAAYTGEYLNLEIQLETGKAALKVDVASVRWSDEEKFGLCFEWLQPRERRRLEDFLQRRM